MREETIRPIPGRGLLAGHMAWVGLKAVDCYRGAVREHEVGVETKVRADIKKYVVGITAKRTQQTWGWRFVLAAFAQRPSRHFVAEVQLDAETGKKIDENGP